MGPIELKRIKRLLTDADEKSSQNAIIILNNWTPKQRDNFEDNFAKFSDEQKKNFFSTQITKKTKAQVQNII